MLFSRNTEFGDVFYTESMQQAAEATVQHFMLAAAKAWLVLAAPNCDSFNYSATLVNVEVRDV